MKYAFQEKHPVNYTWIKKQARLFYNCNDYFISETFSVFKNEKIAF